VHVTHSAWVDLVIHGLAHLPIDPRDASGLHDQRYVEWAAARLRGAERTLPVDAARLAALYDGARDAHLLHALAVLGDDTADLARTASRPFSELTWPDAGRARLAAQLRARLPEPLVDLFRIALWGEVRAGYLEVREREIGPRYVEAAATFAVEMARLSGRCSCFARSSYCLSHPLRAAGRVFRRPGADEPLVVVGIGDRELGITRRAPVVQAVHETMVTLVQEQLPREAAVVDCRPDRDGYSAHLGPEVVALGLGARLLARDELALEHEAWLGRLFPGGSAELAAELARAGLRPRRRGPEAAGPSALARWLASGDAVPDGYAEAWQRASAVAGRRR
jgi:hypothetical protein